MKLEVSKMGEHLGIVFPDDLIASLGWQPGDILEVDVDSDGLKIVRVETAFDRGMRIVEQAMEEYRGTLEALAKS
jgi:putative addiction module antidote